MRRYLNIIVALVILLPASSCRRELYVYGDDFHSVVLNVDWREYSGKDPDGMTVWFYPLEDPSHPAYRMTTANVRKHELYLPGGRYDAVLVDYSPEEYSYQEFLDMDSRENARVKAVPANYQPDSTNVVGEGIPADLNDRINIALYDANAWTGRHVNLPPKRELTNLYTVAAPPEEMGRDTLNRAFVEKGKYGDYIPYKERNTYQSTIIVKDLYATPTSLIWRMRIRIFIREGFNYLWQTRASLTGLSDGHFLPRDVNTDDPCIMDLADWELQRTGDNSGYIATTFTTFGLRPASIRPDALYHTTRAGETEPDYPTDPDWYSYYTDLCDAEEFRLNLAFVLRDHATLVLMSFNVGDYVVSYDVQQVLRIDLDEDFFNDRGTDIILPYVDTYNGAGFDAQVTPWENEDPIDITM